MTRWQAQRWAQHGWRASRIWRMIAGLLVLVSLVSGCGSFFGSQTPAPVIVVATPTPGGAAPATPAPTTDVTDAATPVAAEPPIAETPAADASPAPPDEPASTPPDAATPPPANGGVLAQVKARGRLICGANTDLPGFGFYDSVRGSWSGFDVDFCRAVAAAVLGDANAVDFVALTTSGPNERFEAIRAGRVDVMFRNTTWTLGRDISGLAFGPTTFHDGQTFMVRTADNIRTLDNLAEKTICVARGTTSELNLQEDFAARGITYTLRLFDDENQLYPAYDAGECDAVTSDSSQLASEREALAQPDDHTILGDRISREPLGPVFIAGDDIWRDAVSWAVFATIYAEELRVDQSNVDQLAQTSNDARVRRLLGIEGDFGAGLGLPNDFGLQIIRQVGNYADIYDRNLGPETPFALERGPNKVWNLGAGGVLASPPFR